MRRGTFFILAASVLTGGWAWRRIKRLEHERDQLRAAAFRAEQELVEYPEDIAEFPKVSGPAMGMPPEEFFRGSAIRRPADVDDRLGPVGIEELIKQERH